MSESKMDNKHEVKILRLQDEGMPLLFNAVTEQLSRYVSFRDARHDQFYFGITRTLEDSQQLIKLILQNNLGDIRFANAGESCLNIMPDK
jgi:hypothetical protein